MHGSVWRKLNTKEVMMRRRRVPHDVLGADRLVRSGAVSVLMNYAEKSSLKTRRGHFTWFSHAWRMRGIMCITQVCMRRRRVNRGQEAIGIVLRVWGLFGVRLGSIKRPRVPKDKDLVWTL